VATARAMMERQLAHMVRLIDDLLDISRINQSKMELRRARVLLSEVLSSAVETAAPALESAGHEFTLSQPSEPVYLDADLTRLAQVFSNLLTNSAKYTEPGGRVWLTVDRLGDEVVVVVRDTGIGIPRDAIPHIFDMFSQVDRSIERASGGLGIGLALVKGLVEMHGGTVQAESEGQGRGSVFTVRLPVRGLHAEPKAIDAQDPAPVPGRLRRILVADDNQDSAESMALLLGAMGHDVEIAGDGVEAVERAGRFLPEVILMDIGMPRLNGYDAAQRIREQAWGQDMVIIALTGWGHESDRLQSQDAGCNGHLVKPVSMRDLERLLAGSK
jgi:CheY-like chemotaxis protein